MCGDLDDDARFDEELLAWLVANAATYGAAPIDAAAEAAPAAEPGSPQYMGRQFRQALARTLTEIAALPHGQHADAVRGQAIALARLAGFLGGHLPPQSDIFRDLVDALTDGSREPGEIAEERHADHHHHHNGHGHDHPHR